MSAQLALFAEPAPKERRCGMPLGVQRRWELAFSEQVKRELVAVATARPGEWLEWGAFTAVRERYQIGFCMGHVLSSLVREGRLAERRVYFGKGIDADRPGSPNYCGYGSEWRAAAPSPSATA